MTKNEIVERARALVGVPFRPQGRDPVAALDCVGVVASVFEIPMESVPRDYRLHGHCPGLIKRELLRHFRRVSVCDRNPADVMLCEIREGQLHLAIHCGGSFVHADARLRRVIETPGNPQWPVRAFFRRPELQSS